MTSCDEKETAVLLVVGPPRSGTTIVYRELCAGLGVTPAPETHFFGNTLIKAIPTVALLAPSDGIRRRYLRRMVRISANVMGPSGLSAIPQAIDRESRAQSNGAWEVFVELVRKARNDEAGIVAEKTPGHLFGATVLSRACPTIRWAIIERDILGTVASLKAVPWSPDDVEVLALRTIYMRRLGRALAQYVPRRCSILRYEDFVRDPVRSRELMLMALDLDVATPSGEPRNNLEAPPQTLSTSWETWKTRSYMPIDLHSLDRWQNDLSPNEVRRILAVERNFANGVPNSSSGRLYREWLALLRHTWRIRLRLEWLLRGADGSRC